MSHAPIRDGDYVVFSTKNPNNELENGFMGVRSIIDDIVLEQAVKEQEEDEDFFGEEYVGAKALDGQVDKKKAFDYLSIVDGKLMDIFMPFLIQCDIRYKEGEAAGNEEWVYPSNFHSVCVFRIEMPVSSNKGDSIHFGTGVRLVHRQSQKYLTVSKIPISEGSSNFRLELKKKATHQSVFYI